MASKASGIDERLRRLKPELAEQYVRVRDKLQPVCTSAELDEWSSICAELANSGWHTWESAGAYLEIADDLRRVGDTELLLACGRFGSNMCDVAHEAATAYFRNSSVVAGKYAPGARLAWQEVASTITRRFARPTSMLADYLHLGSAMARDLSEEEFLTWVALAGQLSETNVEHMRGFVTVCQESSSRKLPWAFCRSLQEMSSRACIDYLARSPSISSLGQDSVLHALILKIAIDEDICGQFLNALVVRLEPLTLPRRRDLLEGCLALAEVSPSVANCLLQSADGLPVLDSEQFGRWVEEGSSIARANRSAGEAFFSAESATSLDLLEQLSGQVTLSDVHRMFQLYSEGICGLPLKIETLAEDTSAVGILPHTDGDKIYLPGVITEFGERSENRLLYRISLLHQLGFFECGTFDFRFEDHGDPFAAFFTCYEDADLARLLFRYLEDGRIDAYLSRRYGGIAADLHWLMGRALQGRPSIAQMRGDGRSEQETLLEILLQMTLGRNPQDGGAAPVELVALREAVEMVTVSGASVDDTMSAVDRCYGVIFDSQDMVAGRSPVEGIFYRGSMDPDMVVQNLGGAIISEVLMDLLENEQETSLSDLIDHSRVKVTKLARGDVRDAMGILLTELEQQLDEGEIDEEELEDKVNDLKNMMRREVVGSSLPPRVFFYDEWDYLIGDYRRNWCRLNEIVVDGAGEGFVEETLREYRELLTHIRRQLQMLRPGQQRKVRGMSDGEEVDLDKAVEFISDRKSGVTPDDNIYTQRLRRERDVSALFLLDMSASTDDRIRLPETPSDPEAEPQPKAHTDDEYRDDFLEAFYGPPSSREPDPPRRRIIDVEKESVALMAEALEELGDNYSICGFSGYGREQVDYYLCKDFNEKYDAEAKGRLGAIKPCRSTRMGPAIRHGLAHLERTDSRIKALIIISDGYPQDFDYGADRNEREYGIQDTTRALSEARQKGVQAFCLTVDPSGHDYLREMCAEQNYMVIQDITQLPSELSKIYRGLTA